MILATNSPATNKVIILDSCHSGIIGEGPTLTKMSELVPHMTILTASAAEQYAFEKH
jgi:hypothetical protein